MSEKAKVWGIGTSRTFRVYFALHERGMDYEVAPIRTRTADQDRPDFQAISVSRKIPVLQHDGLVISESAAIARYLLQLGRPSRDLRQQVFCDQWAFHMVSELDATALYVVRRHEGLPEIYGEAERAVQSAKEYFQRQIIALSEQVLVDGRETVFPGEFTELDILLISIVDWAESYGEKIPPSASHWAQRIRLRPAYQQARKVNYGKP
jgi:glutathione S-transferase